MICQQSPKDRYMSHHLPSPRLRNSSAASLGTLIAISITIAAAVISDTVIVNPSPCFLIHQALATCKLLAQSSHLVLRRTMQGMGGYLPRDLSTVLKLSCLFSLCVPAYIVMLLQAIRSPKLLDSGGGV